LENVVKIVSGMDEATLKTVASVYETVVKAGVYKAPNIKTAEAAKVIENTQRDINIALVNELSLMFRLMGLDTLEVLKAAGTKWNFLNFRPGLVGGHCIGVDPYYLTHKAEELGYHPQVILAGRRINDNMGRFVGQNVIKTLMTRKPGKGPYRVGVFGLSFKENVKDLRNSKVFDILSEIVDHGVEVVVNDPHFTPEEVPVVEGVRFASLEGFPSCDAVVLAVAHEAYQKKGTPYFQSILGKDGVLFDLKGIFEPSALPGIHYWRL
jgi:UDP-N-acetyl-D-galactosamine dehydrogenase